jgi:hypothetical protein
MKVIILLVTVLVILGLSYAAPLSPATQNHHGKEINKVDPTRRLARRQLPPGTPGLSSSGVKVGNKSGSGPITGIVAGTPIAGGLASGVITTVVVGIAGTDGTP